ncbi:hypothetical protein [Alteraurantiacibacter buctensis]|uniref:Uncharacterized protein n=1 Tax=Alteraurantiacibacter buctensis TaxID=1503981 RepID=A0A844YSA9_9SPHN|nr:hypothetical protein [Alteraurantiacibacter buctensis]MXO71235.1 hypothetical protein [Alteraurantiacibacter buctensis]
MTLALLLAACGEQGGPVQRVDLQDSGTVLPVVLPRSPDTSQALWLPSADRQALVYGNRGAAPLLTLACAARTTPPRLTIIRHAPALPGQTALFPVIGNGERSRFPVDAREVAGEWRWQVALPADDARWNVFAGSRQLLATLPGGGTLDIAGSRMPGAFLEWCRAGGTGLLPREEDLPPPDETRRPPTRREMARQAAAESDGG